MRNGSAAAMLRRPPPVEFAIAAVVTAVMAVDLGQGASWWMGVLLVVPAGATLAWRTRLPELPLLLICAANLVLMATAPGKFGPQTVVIGMMVAAYTAASQLCGRRHLAAAAVSLALVWAGHVASPDGDAADFWPFLIWGVPWLAGRLVRRQALQARAAGARAALAEREADEAIQRERDRIARELHDVVGHAVSMMVVQAGAARVQPEGAGPRTAAALDAIEVAGRQALAELRAMLGVLRSAGPGDEQRPQPDLSALPELVDHVRAAGLPVQLTVRGDAPVAPGVALAAYRVVQESLTNALRHGAAGATTVDVQLGSEVSVEVVNELPAATADTAHGGGRGIAGMRERVELHGGSLFAGPRDRHWVVSARLPLVR